MPKPRIPVGTCRADCDEEYPQFYQARQVCTECLKLGRKGVLGMWERDRREYKVNSDSLMPTYGEYHTKVKKSLRLVAGI